MKPQLLVLFSLYRKYIALFPPASNVPAGSSEARSERLAWASQNIGRTVSSFNELRASEAGRLIKLLKRALGQEILASRRRPLDRETALAYGTAGRRGCEEKQIHLVADETWKLIDLLLEKLGWTRDRLDRFLRSSKSPVPSGSIRTLSEANRVIWALKGMARRAA